MSGPSNPLAAPSAPETPRAPQMKMTVFMLHDSDTRCLLVTTQQLVAIIELLNVELEVLTA